MRPVCDVVFATVVPDETGGAAVLYWSRSAHGNKLPLVLLDFDLPQLEPKLWEVIRDRLDGLAAERGARAGSAGAWVEGEEIASVAGQVWPDVRPIPDPITSPSYWKSLVLVAMHYVRMNLVGRTELVDSKRERRALGALTFQGGSRPEEDPSVAAYLYGVALALDMSIARAISRSAPKPKAASRR